MAKFTYDYMHLEFQSQSITEKGSVTANLVLNEDGTPDYESWTKHINKKFKRFQDKNEISREFVDGWIDRNPQGNKDIDIYKTKKGILIIQLPINI